MLDLPTLIIVNAVMCVTMSLLMLVSRLTLGAASAGALTWVIGDLPSAWHLSRRFWGARVIVLVLLTILGGKIVSIATHWSAAA